MKTLLRAALALLLAAPALHHPRPAAAPSPASARPRDERFATVAPHRAPAAAAPAPKRVRPPSTHGAAPLAFIPAAGPALARRAAPASGVRALRVPLPRRVNRPAYYATAPPRERR
ncbi:MAG TPA: hypothetical protein VF541_14190 [Longimicrobium sp.]